jgi:hypothetical protein
MVVMPSAGIILPLGHGASDAVDRRVHAMAAGAGNDPGYGRTEGRTGRCIRKAKGWFVDGGERTQPVGSGLSYQCVDGVDSKGFWNPADSPASDQRGYVGAKAIEEEWKSRTRKDNGNLMNRKGRKGSIEVKLSRRSIIRSRRLGRIYRSLAKISDGSPNQRPL